MKTRILILFFILISSCQNFTSYEKVIPYEKIGFAELSINEDIIHPILASESQIKITNLLNKKNIILSINKTSKIGKEREIIIPNKYFSLLELNPKLPIIKVETIKSNKVFKAEIAKIFEEEKKVLQNIETTNVDVIDLSKNSNSKSSNYKNDNLKNVSIYYGDFTFKNTALDMVSLLKKEIKSINPVIVKVNKKFRVKAMTINDINEFDIYYSKIANTKFENYNISIE